MNSSDQPLSVLETFGITGLIVAIALLASILMILLAAGVYVGWHELGPWLAR